MDLRNIEAIYPISPVQEDLLLRAANPSEPEGLFRHVKCDLRGSLDLQALEWALQQLMDRYPILRASFAWERIDKPCQVIHKGLKMPFELQDWSGMDSEEQQARFARLVTTERDCISDAARAPLTRFVLIRIGADAFQLLWTFHPLLLDTTSVPLLLREVFSLCEAYSPGHRAHVEQAPFQSYFRRDKGSDQGVAESYWREELAGFTAPTFLEVPLSPSRRFETRRKSLCETVHLSEVASGVMQAAVEGHQVSITALAAGALALLLSRHCSAEQVVFGLKVSGRPKAPNKAHPMVGPFENTLPLLIRIPEEGPILSWLEAIQSRLESLRAREHDSLSQIRAWCGLPKGLPMFESSLEAGGRRLEGSLARVCGGLRIGDAEVVEQSDSPLVLIPVSGPQLMLRIVYDCNRFDDAYIARLSGHYRALLEGMLLNLSRSPSSVGLLTEWESHQLLTEWNDSRAERPVVLDVCELFDLQVELTPDAVALGCLGDHLSYRQLDERANRLGHYLQELGVGPEVRVGVCLRRSPELVISLLAVLKAGGAYVPLDPAYPIERLVFMLEDAQTAVLVTEEAVLDELPSLWIHVICVDSACDRLRQQPGGKPPDRALAGNPAYVIYTSGSTGRPKGVQIARAGLLNLVFWHQEYYQVDSRDRATQIAGIAFDASVWELWPYLLCGASVHLPDETTRSSPEALRDWLQNELITISFLPTPLAESVMMLDWPKRGALRAMLTGGDKLNAYPPASIPFSLINNYGPTENTVVATAGFVEPGRRNEIAPPIGRPIENASVYVLDKNLQPLPVGVSGELYIGGSSLARGYLNKPDLSAERFIPDPFTREGGGRLYKTGDLVRLNAQGEVEFVGRADYQVKIRGFRIELAEIESALRQHSAVKDAVVLMREDLPGEKRLVGYVVVKEGRAPIAEELRQALEHELPDYMIPSSIVFLDVLPLTAHGKVDRKALPRPDKTRTESNALYAEPQSPAEQVLAGIWSEILGIVGIGIHDNFFQIGGDSILAVQIISRANQAGLQLTTKQLFLHPTIAELASVAAADFTIHAQQGEVTGPVPLTPIQHWFFESEPADPHHYNQSVLLRVPEGVRPQVLRRVVETLFSHHDALRLRFTRHESGWRQFNAAVGGPERFGEMDLSLIPEADWGKAIVAEATRLQASLDLTEGPLCRVALFHAGPSRPGRLLFIVHHLAIDGVSWRILLEDLQTGFEQLSRGRQIELPPKTTSFKRWSERLTEYAESEELEAERAYWLGAPVAKANPLPVDFSGGINSTRSARSVSVSLSVEETRALLQEVPQAYHTEINDVLLTALARSFSKWIGDGLLRIDLEAHGREDLFPDVDLSRTVGWFTAVFPVCLEVREGDGPGDSLKSIKEQLRQVPRRGVGYGVLRHLNVSSGVAEQFNAQPRPEVSFNYLGQYDQTFSNRAGFGWAAESSGPARGGLAMRTHLLEINGSIIGRQLNLAWAYSENIHRGSTIQGLAQSFIESLRELIAHCQLPDAGGYTISDVAEFGWTQDDLNRIVTRIGGDL